MRQRTTPSHVVLLALAAWTLSALVGLSSRYALGQQQPPLHTTLQDHVCWKVRLCTGVAVDGECEPHGLVCGEGTCGAESSPDGCSWYYDWSCNPSCDVTCTHVAIEGIGSDCGPKCKLICYNQCACACKDLGIDTVEGSVYDRCN